MDKRSISIVDEVVENTGLEAHVVEAVLNEAFLQPHKRLLEYRGLNGDYIGESLHYELPKQSFYHLLGFLDTFSSRYNWQTGSASEYLLRLGGRLEWSPYRHQMESWQRPSDDL